MSSPARSSGEEPLIKKTRRRKKKNLTQQSTQISSLPDDMLLSCFARISRLHYPALSSVCKSFRSLLASPELYETRSLLGNAESCLYVCLYLSLDLNPRWFTLCQKPNRKNNSSGNLLVPFPVPKSPRAHWKGVVAVGWSIYVIGGPFHDLPSSDVWVLDFHSLVWRKAPSMLVGRDYPAANVFDGKIYVAGGFKDYNSSSNWMEVFDPKTQTWDFVVCPVAEGCSASVIKSAVIEGKILFYTFMNECLAYSPKEDRWEVIGGKTSLDSGWAWQSYCVIGDVLYSCCISVVLRWFDSKRQYWMALKGLKGLPRFHGNDCVKLADYGGKLAVFWTKYSPSSEYNEKTISCAVISLERRNGDDEDEEIWGTVEWVDPLLTLAYPYRFECALAATV
ncbi:unnamed protein product [Microthlaspi erraticum]|uniref:F-box domain-containing protein n=1 Tax=Microthlaspi erraticum TaxID=1685480 RepID=A0A6D2KLC8_9BRAS|nr:unnamed protein product [Microthlaspi erraticum]